MMQEHQDIHLQKKKNSRHRLHIFKNIHSKLTIDLNVSCKTIKLLDENIRANLCDHRFCDVFRYNTKNIIYERKKLITQTSLKLNLLYKRYC